MSNANTAADLNAENRRSCFRINDRVGLSVTVLTDAEYRAARDSAGTRRQRMQVVNALLVESENQKPFLRKLKKRESDLAEYLESVEDRLQSLAKALRLESSHAPSKPTHDVNISGSGIFLVFVAIAYRGGDATPDPLPHALVLTGIVVAVSATALALALGRRLRTTDDE